MIFAATVEFSWTAMLVSFSGYLLTLLLLRWVLLTRKESPTATVAWAMTIVLVPIIGGLLFLFFGVNRVDRRSELKEQSARSLRDQLEAHPEHQAGEYGEPAELVSTLMRLGERTGHCPPIRGNHVQILSDTNQTLGLIEQAIHQAEHSIHLEYYMWKQDRTGRRVRDLLIERARENIQVRFLYDALGSVFPNGKFLGPMRAAGIEVATAMPGATLREQWSINLRNHRKIVIVDGKVGFTGGMNIGDEYLGLTQERGFWRDTHLRVTGPVVHELQRVFAEDWFFATGRALTDPEKYPVIEMDGHVIAQVLDGGPTGTNNPLRTVLFAAINEAREQVLIASGYFIPPKPFVRAMETASLRGVRVALIVPGGSTYPWTMWAGRSYYETLLTAGVEIYEYQRGAFHAKTFTIDGCWSHVGSTNLDNRSLYLNFEAGISIHSREIAEKLEQDFENDIRDSKRIELETWNARSDWHVMGENVCRMFSPIL
ncbi:cardiolipin synthase [Calycomorphotria hydatis]|uniref:Cardiolipin synthase n=1 Tax=Calycomorphotria hydatis TaxID=2528027 RepID=A0A517T7E0_9PLAN|nr:cardiolipin synthase [Calycomorphotria hydatis]QDT64291.1 Major cardiolipin synthase ClsA [Calycomorphotria hydatis]